MNSRRYQQSLNRQEEMVLPPRVEDYVSETNAVRAIDAYVNTLNLDELNFKYTHYQIHSGQPPYNPAALLKLYLYGYLQRIHSSRRLECETHRNLEVIWLIQGIHPCHKTIADFRSSHSVALKAVNRDFILLCKELSLFGGKEVAVDGSFFNGDTNKSHIYTEKNLSKQIAALEKRIINYQKRIDEKDAIETKAGKSSPVEDNQLPEKIERLQKRQAEKQALQQQLKDSDKKQISTVDKDARLLSKRGQSVAGYNVQIVVDSVSHLIVADEVTQDGNDSHQLAPMLAKAQVILDADNLVALADTGYYSGTQLKLCEEQGIDVYVPIPKEPEAKSTDVILFTSKRFIYDKAQDIYRCPQGKPLSHYGNPRHIRDKIYFSYKSKKTLCDQCPLRSACLTETAKRKEILRWEHHDVYERHQQRMEQRPNNARQRGSIVEHPFGTLKQRAGMHHFLMRGLDKCQGEFSLMVLSYNFTRVLNMLGVDVLRDYCAQRSANGLKKGQYA